MSRHAFIHATSAGAVLFSLALFTSAAPRRPAATATRDVNFVRPGLTVKIVGASIAADGTITARVSFTDPQGLPLDIKGVNTPGAISAGSPGMIASVLPAGQTEFVAYTTRVQSSTITNQSATQASTDSGGTWTANADGSYTYTFRTKAPSGFNASAVHAIGVYAARNLTDFDLGTNLDDDVYYFTPNNGQQVSNPREIIATATCQKCHGPNMHFHGETGRSSVQMCDLCHTAQTTDPDTRNTLDLRVFIHKVHMGAQLPSVQAGGKYQIIGFGNAVNDWSTVQFPSPIVKCQVCHVGDANTTANTGDATQTTAGATVTNSGNPGTPGTVTGRVTAQHNNWLTNPTMAACGSCHDDVNFATGQNHPGGPQVNDAQCANCHIPQGELEFDASIMGAHVYPPESTLLSGFRYAIRSVANTAAGQKPAVTFTLTDKNGGALPISAMNRLAVTLAGPTTDYVDTSTNRGYVQETITAANVSGGSNGVYTYTMTSAIPANATGTFAVGLEGRRVETILAGTTKQRSVQYGATNPVAYFSVDGSKVQPRREPAGNGNCLNCHYRLALHGENRVNNIEYCQFCHNPVENDAAFRPANQGPPQTIAFKFMIHRIHGGEELNNAFGTDFVVYGFGGSRNSFADVRYPAPLTECFMCHVGGSENPTEAAMNESPVNTPQYPINPMGPTTTACFGCHDSRAMLSHALSNTTQLGEACSACHSAGADFSATKEHADAEGVTVSSDQNGK